MAGHLDIHSVELMLIVDADPVGAPSDRWNGKQRRLAWAWAGLPKEKMHPGDAATLGL